MTASRSRRQRWAAAVDCVGGDAARRPVPADPLRRRVAASGLTAGIKVETTVMPFILRSVSLLGVDSVQTPMEERAEIWQRLADDLRPPQLDDAIAREIGLDELEGALDAILKGELTGAAIVTVGGLRPGDPRSDVPGTRAADAVLRGSRIRRGFDRGTTRRERSSSSLAYVPRSRRTEPRTCGPRSAVQRSCRPAHRNPSGVIARPPADWYVSSSRRP